MGIALKPCSKSTPFAVGFVPHRARDGRYVLWLARYLDKAGF